MEKRFLNSAVETTEHVCEGKEVYLISERL